MRRDNIFWGFALLLLGVLLLLQARGIIENVFTFFWPIALILVGGWLILSVYWQPAAVGEETFTVPLEAAQHAAFNFSHGAGEIRISGGAPAGQAIVGTAAAGMKHTRRMDGDRLTVKVDAGPSFVPFVGPSRGAWRFQLTQQIPLSLVVETGASSLDLDLRDVRAEHVELKTGASSSNVVMPARGASRLEVESGAASINIRIPEGTQARIRVKGGMSATSVDTSRFPRLDSGVYESAGYETATDRAELVIESGMGSVTVK